MALLASLAQAWPWLADFSRNIFDAELRASILLLGMIRDRCRVAVGIPIAQDPYTDPDDRVSHFFIP